MLFGNINRGLAEYQSIPDAMLVDVRERDEYSAGHIPGAVNVPISEITAAELPKDKPLFLYCLRGTRSKRAASFLKRTGHTVKSIGGISGYRGKLSK